MDCFLSRLSSNFYSMKNLSVFNLFLQLEYQLALEKTLCSFPLSQYYYEKRLTPAQTELLICSLPIWFYLFLENKFVANGVRQNRDYQFTLFFNYLFNPAVGFFVENIVFQAISALPDKKELFKTSFLRFQKKLETVFFPNRSLECPLFGLQAIFFNKINLLKITRLLLNVYNPQFWNNLKPEYRFEFCKKILSLTLQFGTYNYINSLLLPIKHQSDTQVILNLGSSSFLIELQSTRSFASKSVQKSSAVYVTKALQAFKIVPKSVAYFLLVTVYGSFLVFFHKTTTSNTTYNTVWSPTIATIGGTYGRSQLPLASMSTSKFCLGFTATKQPQVTRSRALTPNVTATTRALDIQSPERNFVTLTVPQTTNKLVIGASIPITVHSQYKEKQLEKFETKTFQCIITSRTGVTEGQIPPSDVLLLCEGIPLLHKLYAETPLGDKESGERVMQRNLHTDFAIVDPSANTDLEANVITNYGQKDLVKDHILIRCGRALLQLAESKKNKGLEGQVFVDLRRLSGSSKSSSVSDSALLAFMSDYFRISKSQAAHFTTDKMAKVLKEEHKDQATMYTYKAANGPTSYDSISVNTLDITEHRSIASLLTSNLGQGHAKLLQALDQLPASQNALATGLMADVCHDSYSRGRILVGNLFTKTVMRMYTNNTNKQTINKCVLDFFESFYAYNNVIINHCIANLQLYQNTANSVFDVLISRLLPGIKDYRTSVLYPKNYSPSGKTNGKTYKNKYSLESVNKDIQKLELDQTNWEKSYKAIGQLTFVNSIIHCLICDKSPTESLAFVQEVSKCIQSNGAASRKALKDSGNTAADLDFLTQTCLQISTAHNCCLETEYRLSQINSELEVAKTNLAEDIQDSPLCKDAEYSYLFKGLEDCHGVLENVVKSLNNKTEASLKAELFPINSSKEIEKFFGDKHTFREMCQASKALMTYPTLDTAPEAAKTTFLQMAEKVQNAESYQEVLSECSPSTSDWLHTTILGSSHATGNTEEASTSSVLNNTYEVPASSTATSAVTLRAQLYAEAANEPKLVKSRAKLEGGGLSTEELKKLLTDVEENCSEISTKKDGFERERSRHYKRRSQLKSLALGSPDSITAECIAEQEEITSRLDYIKQQVKSLSVSEKLWKDLESDLVSQQGSVISSIGPENVGQALQYSSRSVRTGSVGTAFAKPKSRPRGGSEPIICSSPRTDSKQTDFTKAIVKHTKKP